MQTAYGTLTKPPIRPQTLRLDIICFIIMHMYCNAVILPTATATRIALGCQNGRVALTAIQTRHSISFQDNLDTNRLLISCEVRIMPNSKPPEVLDLAKRLSEEEKRVIEEFKEMRGYYYLGYMPVVYRIEVNV